MRVVMSKVIVTIPALPRWYGHCCYRCGRFLRLKDAVKEPMENPAHSILFCSTACHTKQIAAWKSEGVR